LRTGAGRRRQEFFGKFFHGDYLEKFASQLGERVLMAVCSRDRHDSKCQVQALVIRRGTRTATSATRSAASFTTVDVR